MTNYPKRLDKENGIKCTLFNPEATRSGNVTYVSFIEDKSGNMIIVIDDCISDSFRFVSKEEARNKYKFYTKRGFLTSKNVKVYAVHRLEFHIEAQHVA